MMYENVNSDESPVVWNVQPLYKPAETPDKECLTFRKHLVKIFARY